MIFFSFLYSEIPDTSSGILKMLIRVFFRNLLQPAVFDLYYYLILGSTNNVLHSSVKTNFVHSVESGTSEKILQ